MPKALLHDGILPGLLKPQLVRLADLQLDPKNARKHPRRNVEAIAASLQAHGQHAPLVVQVPGNIIRKGNGTYLAMLELGWESAAAVLISEDDGHAIARALADNRAGELSSFDEKILASLLDELPDELTAAAGFDEAELARLAKQLEADLQPASPAPAEPPAPAVSEEPAPARAPRTASYTAMIHLYYSEAEKAELEGILTALSPAYLSDNLSQTVLLALRELVELRKAAGR